MATVTGSSPGTLILGDRDEWWKLSFLGPDGQGAVIGWLAALNHENEWHYVNGTLYFRPPNGKEPSNLLIEVKNRL